MLQYTANEIYEICNQQHWFTGGTNEQYSKVMGLADEGKDVETLALAIWLCTPDKKLEEIKEEMKSRCEYCDHFKCPHRNAYRRLPKAAGGLGLCLNL